MAGDWLKVEKATPNKPAIAILARKLKVSRGDAFLNWFLVYSWLDEVTASGSVPNVSLQDGDMLSGAKPGTCTALASKEIGWLTEKFGKLCVKDWETHNGKSAKSRALEKEKKRNQREKLFEAVPRPTGQNGGPQKTDRTDRQTEELEKTTDLTVLGSSSSGQSESGGVEKGASEPELFRTDQESITAGEAIEISEQFAKELFDRMGYTGKDGALVWKVAIAVRVLKKIPEGLAVSAATGAKANAKTNAIGHFRKTLRNSCTAKGLKFENVIGNIDLPEGGSYGPPQIAVNVFAMAKQQLAGID